MCLQTKPGAHVVSVFWSAGSIAGCLGPSSGTKVIAEIAENKSGGAFSAALSFCCGMMFTAFSAEQIHTVSVRL